MPLCTSLLAAPLLMHGKRGAQVAEMQAMLLMAVL